MNLMAVQQVTTSQAQAAGRRLLADSQDNVGINVTVTAPSANASDVADLLRTSANSGALQQAIAAAGMHLSAAKKCEPDLAAYSCVLRMTGGSAWAPGEFIAMLAAQSVQSVEAESAI